jgi:hypothetical protein
MRPMICSIVCCYPTSLIPNLPELHEMPFPAYSSLPRGPRSRSRDLLVAEPAGLDADEAPAAAERLAKARGVGDVEVERGACPGLYPAPDLDDVELLGDGRGGRSGPTP